MQKRGFIRILSVVTAAAFLGGCGLGSATVQQSSSSSAASQGQSSLAEGEVPEPSAVKGERDQEIYDFITAKSDNPDKVLIRFSCTERNFEDTAETRGEREFFRSLKESLGDKIEIQPYFSGTLGSTTDDILGGLINGSFEFSSFSLGSYAELTKAFNPLDVPYVFSDVQQAYDCMSGEMGELMRQRCIEDTGIRVVAMKQLGMRQLTNSKEEIKTVDAIKGKKIRVQMNNMFIALMDAWGAGATPVAYTELYTALQQGVVDGQENPITNIYDSRLYEVQDYMTLTNHMPTISGMSCNNSWYEGLSDEFKAAIDKAAKDCEEMTLEALRLCEEDYMNTLKAEMNVYEPTPEELQTFIDAAKTMWPQAREYCGEEYFDQVMAAAGITME